MYKLKFNSKKGMMDDFFDFVFTVITLFFMLFFVHVALNSSADTQHDATLTTIEQFQHDERLFHYLHAPVFLSEQELLMKDLILLSVNTNQEDLFEEYTKNYFEFNTVEGSILIYDSAEYQQGKSPLYSQSTSILSGKRKSVLELPNVENKKIPTITVVFQS